MPEKKPEKPREQPAGRPFIGIHLGCCNVYVRAYLNTSRDAFTAWCPRCAAPVRVRAVPGDGSGDRFFRAS